MQSSDPEDMAWNDGKRAAWEQALDQLKRTQAKLTSAYGRIADLERQLAVLNNDWKEKCIEADTLRKHLEVTEELLAEARKDTERLDWLDANREVIDQAMNGGE